MVVRNIRFFCKRCNKWYDEVLNSEELETSSVGVYLIAFDHGDHIITVYLDGELSVRGETIVSKVAAEKTDEETQRALEYFDRY